MSLLAISFMASWSDFHVVAISFFVDNPYLKISGQLVTASQLSTP
ncbi:MAG: hypothetical protein ACXAEU_20100 [Candidatus Hodarchaeales archaeon]